MKISIIIPSYNRAQFIVETLHSVASQTSSNWECFIVDDGSTDNTEEVVSKFISEHQNYPFFWLKNQRTKGAQGARNTGLLHSTGDFLIFLDSDDILDKHCIEHRLEKVKDFPTYDYYAFPIMLFNKERGDSEKIWNTMNKYHLDILDRFLLHDAPWQTLGCLWSRKAIVSIGMWDEKVTSLQDWDAHIQAVMHPQLKGWLNPDEQDFDAFYRVGSYDSVSKKFASRKGAVTNFYLVDKTIKTLRDNQLLDNHLPALRRFLWIMGTLISIGDHDLGKEFYTKYSLFYQMNGLHKLLYDIYANYRFDMTKPRWLRGGLSKIPNIFKIKNMTEREDTCMNLTVKDLTL